MNTKSSPPLLASAGLPEARLVKVKCTYGRKGMKGFMYKYKFKYSVKKFQSSKVWFSGSYVYVSMLINST